MDKRTKTGGRVSVDGEAREKKVAVRESVKTYVESFRNLLDDPAIAETAIKFLEELESMKDSIKDNDRGG